MQDITNFLRERSQQIVESGDIGIIKLTEIADTKLGIKDVIIIPDGVDVVGENSHIGCLSQYAQIRCSEDKIYAEIPRGIETGGFTIDGNGIAENPFFVGYCTRSFRNISIINAANIGAVIQETQNSSFDNFSVTKSGKVNLKIDKGCRTLSFRGRNIFSRAGELGVLITHSGTPKNSSATQNGNLSFYSTLIEGVESDTAMKIEAGTSIDFWSINTSGGGIILDRLPEKRVAKILFYGGEIDATSTCLTVGRYVRTTIIATSLSRAKLGIHADQTARIQIPSLLPYSTEQFSNIPIVNSTI